MTSTTGDWPRERQARVAALRQTLRDAHAELAALGAEPIAPDVLPEIPSLAGPNVSTPRPSISAATTLTLLGDLIAKIPAVSFVKDLRGVYLAVNGAFEKQFGLTAAAVIGRTDRDLFPPKQAAAFEANDRAVLEERVPKQFEERADYADGHHVSVVSKFPVWNEAGELIALCGMALDITERKRAEDALRAITESLSAAQRIAHLGSWELDFQASALRWSDELFRIAGYEPGTVEVTRELFYQHVHPEDRQRVQDAVAAAIRNRADYSIIHRFTRRDGAVRIMHEMGHLVFDEVSGELQRMEGTAHDITEQRESEQLFRELTESIQEVFWLTDALTGRLLYVSPNYETMWGRSLAELHANPRAWLESVVPEDRAALASGESHQPSEITRQDYRIIRPDGTQRWIAERAFPIRDASGNVVRIAGVALDVTEQKQAELELARSNRNLQMLTACHQAVIHLKEEPALIQQICQQAVDLGGYRMSWVGFAANDASKMIVPVAWAGEEAGYLSEIQLTWGDSDPDGRGPAADAIRSGLPAVCEDLQNDPVGDYVWKQAAAERGYHSVICLPLRTGGTVFGVLALYGAECQKTNPEDLKLLQDFADNLAFGIRSIRSQIQQQRTQEMVMKLAQSVSTKSGTEFFSTLTRNMAEALQATGGTIGKRRAEDPKLVDTLAFFLRGQEIDNVCYSTIGTPCEQVLEGSVSLHESELQQRFPEDLMLEQAGLHSYAGIPLYAPNGEVTGLMSVFFDHPIREPEIILSTLKIFASRAGAEVARLEADARIREQASLLDNARDAILVRDLDHRITYWNKGAERLYGWTAAEAVGRKINEFLYKNDSAFQAATRAAFARGEWVGEIEQFNRAGQALTVEARWTVVYNPDGQPRGVLAINSDITERKKLEAQFFRTQRLQSIGTLAGGIAHDLNNVLGPILMGVQYLRSRPAGDATEILDTLETTAQRGADLVRQVLSFARGVEGQRLTVDLAQAAWDVEKILRETLPKNIRAVVSAPRDLWPVHGDPTQLHQVLMNLCVNARDAMPGGGTLLVSLDNVEVPENCASAAGEAKAGPHVKLMVCDTGAGMSAEVQDKIFEPFFTTKAFGQGTGLGLSTTLAIVKSHGGFIQVTSQPGKGTDFSIFIPSAMQAPSATKPPDPAALRRGRGELILVVDDESAMRIVAQGTLETFGYQVLVAENGLEATELYRKRGAEIAVVLTDMAMPVMDGPATIRALREINPAVRIIASSGLSTPAEITEAVGRAPDLFLPKPYSTASLLKVIRDLIDRP